MNSGYRALLTIIADVAKEDQEPDPQILAFKEMPYDKKSFDSEFVLFDEASLRTLIDAMKAGQIITLRHEKAGKEVFFKAETSIKSVEKPLYASGRGEYVHMEFDTLGEWEPRKMVSTEVPA